MTRGGKDFACSMLAAFFPACLLVCCTVCDGVRSGEKSTQRGGDGGRRTEDEGRRCWMSEVLDVCSEVRDARVFGGEEKRKERT